MLRAFTVAPLILVGIFGVVGRLALAHDAPSASTPPSVEVGPALPESSDPAPMNAACDSAFARLPAIRFSNQNTGQSADVRLYDAGGHVDEQAAVRLDALLCDTRDPKAWASITLDRRTLQLAVRAALHFHASELEVVSAYRKPGRRREGPHASGKALDFKLPGVNARTLAAYLRTLPRVGVGIYTHPKTSFVHLDDREHSFHWLDASPPGRSWREVSIGNASLGPRDAAYVRADDWPEGMAPP